MVFATCESNAPQRFGRPPAALLSRHIGVDERERYVVERARARECYDELVDSELTEFLRNQIAPHKVPVFWSFADGLPMTPTGKTQKYLLRQQVADGTLTFDEIRPSRSTRPRPSRSGPKP